MIRITCLVALVFQHVVVTAMASAAPAVEPGGSDLGIASLLPAQGQSTTGLIRIQPAPVPAIPAQPKGRWMTVVATAYSPVDVLDSHYHAWKGARWRWITADGHTDVREEPYGIAVPRLGGNHPVWAFGTKVMIPTGYGYLDHTGPANRIFTVDDTGSAIRTRTRATGMLHLDLRFRSEASARAFGGTQGSKKLRVYVLEDGSDR